MKDGGRGQPAVGRLIAVSVWVALGWALVAIVWGLLVQSQMIVFDGLYSLISVLLSLMSLLAFRTIQKGPDQRFPFGRDVLEPLTIVFKSFAIAVLCVYALTTAIIDLARGGRAIDAGWAIAYAALATIGCLVVFWYLRHRQQQLRSDLLRAETTQWLMDTVLSACVLVGFGVAAALQQLDRADLAVFVDPAMVAIASAVFLLLPIRLLVSGFRELLAMAPADDLRERVEAQVRAVEAAQGFEESFIRTLKTGSRLDVEVDFVVSADSHAHDVHALDRVRQDLTDRLAPLGYDQWVRVSFTADRRWAE